MSTPLRYVALGDSYTIGTAVSEAERWPNQLVARLSEADHDDPPTTRLELVANLGVNGFTSANVIDVELPRLAALEPEFLTLLVGVNDVVQDVPPATYRRNVEAIFDVLLGRVGRDRVLGVTTPDYTVTPAGAHFGDPTTQAAAIRDRNRTFTELAVDRGIAVVDIHDISLRAAADRDLVARDGLHPSGAQYSLWTERMLETIKLLLTRTP